MGDDYMNVNDDIYVTQSSMPPYEEYCKAIRPLWESHWLTNMGVYHQELEHQLADYLDVHLISLTVNGHMALELAIQAFDFPEGSEVITTPFTFISTTHAIVRNGLKPVFCDVKETDGTIDETKIEELITPNTVAILPVHVYGHVCNVDYIQKISQKYGLKVIYDAAHAFGIKIRNEAGEMTGIGNYGDATIFSFHATKVYNTIEGGAVVCKNREMYDRLYNLKNFGIRGEEVVVSVGANAKMNEFSAIMGLLNLKYIGKAIGCRKKAFKKYEEKLTRIVGIRILGIEHDEKEIINNYAYLPILVGEDYAISRDDLYDLLLSAGIHARKYFYPTTADQACFKNLYKKDNLQVARNLSGKVLVLPIYEKISNSEIDHIVDVMDSNSSYYYAREK